MSVPRVKATIHRSHLASLLNRVAPAIGRRYSYVLLDVYLVRIVATATTHDLTIRSERALSDGDRVDLGGKVCLSAKVFLEIIQALPDLQLDLIALENHGLQIECGDYTGVVPGVHPLEHFPDIPEVAGEHDELCLDSQDLADLQAATAHALSRDEAAGAISGHHLSLDQGLLCCVATDGKRLSLATRNPAVHDSDLSFALTLPGKACGILAKLEGSCTVSRDDSRLQLATVGDTYLFQLLAEEYPAFRRIIPTDHPGCLVVAARELAAIIERVDILSQSDGVLLDIVPGSDDAGDIRISVLNDQGECSDLAPAEVTGPAAQFRVAPLYLLQALKSLSRTSKDVVLKYGTGGHQPLVLLPADHSGWDERLEIIMPMRLG